MKKLLLLSTALLGAIPASQAGVNLSFGIDLPIPLPPPFVISRPPPVVVRPAPPICEPSVVLAPPVCAPPRVVYAPPPVYYGHYYPPYRRGYYVHRGWERSPYHRHW